MVDSGPFVIAAVFVLIGVAALVRARGSYGRYTTLSELSTEGGGPEVPGESVVRGPVRVTEPATPERTASESADSESAFGTANGADPPALWAWRVRQKVSTGGNQAGSRWKTADGGLAVGEFAVRDDWERVRVDAAGIETEGGATDDGPTDPFDAPSLYLGDPERDVPLGEVDPLTKRLEKWGITGDGGLLSGWEFTVSIGRNTLTPDRYQATVIREGEDLIARGELDETADDAEIRGTDETPLMLAIGDIEAKADRFRTAAFRQGAFGFGLAMVGIAVGIAGVL